MSDLSRSEQIELLLDHFENPHHSGEMKDADVQLQGGNPGCGDVVTLFLKIKDGRIRDISFTGDGCTISQASTSLLTDEVLGASLEDIQELDYALVEQLVGTEMVQTRPKCATLGLDTLKKAVQLYHNEQRQKR